LGRQSAGSQETTPRPALSLAPEHTFPLPRPRGGGKDGPAAASSAISSGCAVRRERLCHSAGLPAEEFEEAGWRWYTHRPPAPAIRRTRAGTLFAREREPRGHR